MIKILHGADLHLDSPFSSLTPQQAAACRARQRQLPQTMVRLANDRQCQLLLLVGDVFDSHAVYPETVQALCDALSAFRGYVFISPGNHDPYGEIWDRPWPENVHIFKAPYECVTLEHLGCRIHGGAFLQDVCDIPLPAVQRQGYVEIGVFHGDCVTAGPYRPVTREQIEQSGLDYLALGHIHKPSFPRRLGNTWFGWPGVSMGRGFDEQGKCGVLYVQLDGGSCAAEFIPVPAPTYETVTVSGEQEPVILPDSENIHCRMVFTGQRAVLDLAEIRRVYGPRYLSLELIDQTQPVQDLWQACGDGTLRGMALQWLKETQDAELAELAAAYLLSALEGREVP